MTTGEDAHGCDYFTLVFLLPQLCNSTLFALEGTIKCEKRRQRRRFRSRNRRLWKRGREPA
ncbi:hypothetical protein HMPREF0298_1031, partial [Corynebacterium lipophiloflavum DSM 44291]